ncbi:PilZ domain-containing protein [Thiorhodococcus fuscus]|uniref:PilZ domain-containing protein n=1 Tax=Thiorhodococcus fuscus TaxID=527200 RepID=A0ABW4YBU9_9GAMM
MQQSIRTMNHSESGEIAPDRRTQARIEVRIPVKVTLPGEEGSITGVNEDISWGGALLRIPGPLPKVAGNIRLVYPWKQGDSIAIEGRMLRAKPLDDGRHYEVAVRFVSLSPRSQSRLVKLLKLLRNGRHSADASDTSALVRELEVEVNDADNLRSMLKQIAKGQHSLTVFDAYEPNQSISLSIVGAKNLPGIRLRARVIHVEKSHAKGFEWAELYTLMLGFEHPIKALRASVKMLLEQLPAERESALASEAAPDWLRATPFARPTVADRARFLPGSNALSVLEADFPEALNRLIVGWGDVEMFESLFRDLTLGDQGLPGGWPPDAWAELEMLQDVHDLSYGKSSERSAILKGGRVT